MSASNARLPARLLAMLAFACTFGFASAEAAPINYGDFTGPTVMYIDVTETANTPFDAEPLFGPPTLLGDSLDFEPSTFAAQSSGAATVLTEGQLGFDLMSQGAAINSLAFSEAGDYTLTGAGTSATEVTFTLKLSSIQVLAIDGADLGASVDLSGATVTGLKNLAADGEGTGLWSMSLDYDVDAALANAGLKFEFGATKLRVLVEDNLRASSELITTEISPTSTSTYETAAFIAKKDFVIDAVATIVPAPEPSLIGLLGTVGGVAAVARRRRTARTG